MWAADMKHAKKHRNEYTKIDYNKSDLQASMHLE